MLFYKKILILILLFVFLFFIYRLIKRNRRIKELFSIFETDTSEIPEDNPLPGISNCNNTSLKLTQYCIKSSYNSAFDGSKISLDALNIVLSRGCRFLDFAIRPLIENNNVAYVVDDNTLKNTPSNSILLTDVLANIAETAFMSPCPNTADPIFLHLRILSENLNNTDLYQQIAMAIDNNLKPKLYTQPITENTTLSDVMGKVVIVFDLASAPNYGDTPDCYLTYKANQTCYNLKKYVNVESNSDFIYEYEYYDLIDQKTSPPHVNIDNTTNQNIINIVTPGSVNGLLGYISNPSYRNLITDYGIQIHLMRFYIKDSYLNSYERDFSNNRSAFVPMGTMIKYINGDYVDYQSQYNSSQVTTTQTVKPVILQTQPPIIQTIAPVVQSITQPPTQPIITELPTQLPTIIPTTRPVITQPVITQPYTIIPTTQPVITQLPTTKPTTQPVITQLPTTKPTTRPTVTKQPVKSNKKSSEIIILPNVLPKGLPKVELPKVLTNVLPKVDLPKVELPKVNLQNVLPKVELPKVNLQKVLPKVNLPKVNLPKVNLPKIKVPKIHLPKIHLL